MNKKSEVVEVDNISTQFTENDVMTEKSLEPTITVEDLQPIMKQVDELIEYAKSQNAARAATYGLTVAFCNEIATMKDDDIDSISLPDITKLLDNHGLDNKKVLEIFMTVQNGMSCLEKWIELLHDIKKSFSDIQQCCDNKDYMEEYANIIYSKQLEYLNSSEYYTEMESRISELKALAETSVDETERRVSLRKLNVINNIKTLGFLKDRLVRNGDREVARLVDNFFIHARGEYMLMKYRKVIDKLHIATNYHVHLVNIEEKFLPEWYWPYNGFFISLCMNYISHIDVYDEIEVLYVRSIFSKLGSLVNGELNDVEKSEIISLIKEIYEYVLKDDVYTDKFKEKNSLWKEHPERIAMEKEIAERLEERKIQEEIRRRSDEPVDVTNSESCDDSNSTPHISGSGRGALIEFTHDEKKC